MSFDVIGLFVVCLPAFKRSTCVSTSLSQPVPVQTHLLEDICSFGGRVVPLQPLVTLLSCCLVQADKITRNYNTEEL